MSIMFDTNMDVYFEYGTAPGNYTLKTDTYKTTANTPIEVDLTGLNANTKYYYRTRYKVSGTTGFSNGVEHTFQTPRPSGTSFTFAIEADPHLDENTLPESYTLTLKNILAAKPDFLVDLGDDFMTDKLAVKTQPEITARTVWNRSFFNETCHSVPLYLALGNHEGEAGFMLNNTANNVPVMGANTRKLYYPNPIPNEYYTGNETVEPFVGLRENYYSWEWGNALFVVLDPYWYTQKKGDWGWSLGKTQYDWFKKVLSTSKSKFKFVFCHQLVGSNDTDGRGGSEVAHLFEQGGSNLDGSYGFDTNRPGWGKPLNALMKENNVTIFFHGHDHFYGKQEKFGLIFQEVPQPSAKNITNITGLDYGYVEGVLMPNRGYLRVTVGNDDVKVEYIKTYLPTEEKNGLKNGDVAHSYTVTQNTVTGLPQITEKEMVNVFPNAAKDLVRVEFAEPTTSFQIVVADMTGKIIFETSKNELDVSHLPNGTYLLNVQTPKYQFNKKLIVVH
ncbi:MAG: metallophosphoesterase [Spirosomataceae bacterium]